jgi:hypothetical protein
VTFVTLSRTSSEELNVVSLLLEIARCPNVKRCLEDGNGKHPCAQVVAHQGTESLRDFQLPEPWSGQIESAPIMFLSSNPSIGADLDESHPRWLWSGARITDYFTYRFGDPDRPAMKPPIEKGIRSLHADGTYGPKIHFWVCVKELARELLLREVEPGVDYALSEVVHCKSLSQAGVGNALNECTGRYLKRVVAASAAKVIVCLGASAARGVRSTFPVPRNARVHGPLQLGGHERYFTFLGHPSGPDCKKFATCLSSDERRRLREFLDIDP